MDHPAPALRRPLPLAPTTRPAAVGAGTEPAIRTLLDDFLAKQADTTAVQRFDQHHDGATGNVRERWYRDLLPATPPEPGQQYAFEVDLDACSGCKACVVACNQLNGLEPDESWRRVGSLVGVGERGLSQPVTTSCHHCAEPGCLDGCPVDAYEKDPVTGIVRHLDDQCIGCRYCTLSCPYDVPEYRDGLGIVRKCDMCHDRLAEGEAPACVQACPTQAISIRVVDLDDVGAEPFPFASPDPATTRPATTYTTTRDLHTDVEPADLPTVVPSHAHPPLTVMLVLTQVAVGAFAMLAWLAPGLGEQTRLAGHQTALVLALVALAASVAHLGRPHLAYRAVLGLRHSWLSREIVAFGLFATLGVAGAAGAQLAVGDGLVAGLESAAAAVGLVAVWCSAMVYVVTGRGHWRWTRTVPRFLATTVAGGGAVALLAIAVAMGPTGGALPDVLVGLTFGGGVAALTIDLADVGQRRRGPGDARGRTGILLSGALRNHLQARVALAVLALGALGVAVTLLGGGPGGSRTAGLAYLTVAATGLVGADLVERWWFFTAEAAVRMPGGRP